jgi:hypothetical protein
MARSIQRWLWQVGVRIGLTVVMLAVIGLTVVMLAIVGAAEVAAPMLQGPNGQRTVIREAYPQVARGVTCTANPIPQAHTVNYTCSDGSLWMVYFNHVDRAWILQQTKEHSL